MMQRAKTPEMFKAQSQNFKAGLAAFPLVVAYYEKEWEKDAQHWAAFGREDVAHLASDTNNLVERFNLTLKYVFGQGRVHNRLQDHIGMLVFDVNEHFMLDRMRKVCGKTHDIVFISQGHCLQLALTPVLMKTTSIYVRCLQVGGFQRTRAHGIDEKHQESVTSLVASQFAIQVLKESYLLACVQSQSTKDVGYMVSCADLGCECAASRVELCKHAEALAQKHKLTLPVILAGTAEIVERARGGGHVPVYCACTG